MLAQIVPGRLVAHEQQPVGEPANPLALAFVVSQLERDHVMQHNQMPCRALGARAFLLLHTCVFENVSQEFHGVTNFATVSSSAADRAQRTPSYDRPPM
jgi:hypothetical protein